MEMDSFYVLTEFDAKAMLNIYIANNRVKMQVAVAVVENGKSWIACQWQIVICRRLADIMLNENGWQKRNGSQILCSLLWLYLWCM